MSIYRRSEASTPVLLRPRNFQWYWNSSADPWATIVETEQLDVWQKYTDVENEILEDAFNNKIKEVELDCDYVVNFKHEVQYNKRDKTKQRPIKRVQLLSDRSNVHLREERFSSTITLTDSSTMAAASTDDEQELLRRLREYGDLSDAYLELELVKTKTNKTFADVVEEAASGILKEGAKLGKEKEAKWLAQRLIDVKLVGEKLEAGFLEDIPQQIGETCIYLYTKESFWYKLLNSTLRCHQTMTREHVKTMGPFCWLLKNYIVEKSNRGRLTVYRGLTLTDEQRKEFTKEKSVLTHFTSTSTNRKLAERFGNTLLVFDLNMQFFGEDRYKEYGMDVSSISDFPNEEEYTMYPGTKLRFVRAEYDNEAKKHIIYLTTCH
ncbi:unnamed protein product [Didymodactylos carnosus]|uniref:NAD(P)(+)--arginine ADP-ribosyltransferase n=1 Tax=Didymodactylos carnosus TaxID=1234261 RepID=A0A8S2R9S3_9BILA|nr:unnamed protein product [Didymodactylos carnosus]CAF4152968.1 unnamed protein product [Didymodactylos carnosus]